MIASHIIKNPEFIKNVQLEFTKTRLALALVLLVLISWITWSGVTITPNDHAPLRYYQAKALIAALSGMGFIFTILWGSYLVASGIADEVRERTWDFVRMSSLSPSKIIVGKLLGSASVVWIVTIFAIAPLFIWASFEVITASSIRPAINSVAPFIGCILLWAMISHALAFLTALVSMNYSFAPSKHNAMGVALMIFLMGSAIGAFIFDAYDDFYLLSSAGGMQVQAYEHTMVRWYGFKFFKLDNTLLVLAFWAFWVLAATYRLLRKSLQFQDAPVFWIAFLITSSLFMNGYAAPDEMKNTIFFWPLAISGIALFFTCVLEGWNIVHYKNALSCLKQKKYADLFRVTPLWIIAFAFFTVSVLLNLLIYKSGGEAHPFLISGFLFVCRDILAVHIVYWTRKIRRPFLGLGLYFGVFYFLSPAIAKPFSEEGWRLFYPLTDGEPALSGYWIFLLAQIGVFAVLLARRAAVVFTAAHE